MGSFCVILHQPGIYRSGDLRHIDEPFRIYHLLPISNASFVEQFQETKLIVLQARSGRTRIRLLDD